MTVILALDTCEHMLSVALHTPSRRLQRQQDVPRLHAEKILPAIDRLLTDAELALTDIDAIAFGAGPGAFTGLRIAASVTQGLCFALRCPAIGISTLAALAQGCYRRYGHTQVLSMLDARMGEVYWGLYQLDGATEATTQKTAQATTQTERIMRPVQADALNKPADVLSLCTPLMHPENRCWGTGSGWALCADQQTHPRIQTVSPAQSVDAQDIAVLAADVLLQNELKKLLTSQSPQKETALPQYLRHQVT